jgi:hypothetical protein
LTFLELLLADLRAFEKPASPMKANDDFWDLVLYRHGKMSKVPLSQAQPQLTFCYFVVGVNNLV